MIVLPGPPELIDHELRYDSQNAAYMTSGLLGSSTRSDAPVRASRKRICCHVRPPSVLL
jgi:hypothetical protein